MKLLDIKVPPTTRIQYANLESQEKWSKKIEIGKNLYPNLEYLTVREGVRKCMIAHHVDPYNLDEYCRKLSRDGLLLVPLSKEGVSNGSGFGHLSSDYNGQGEYTYRAVITKSVEYADEFVHAHINHDDKKIGELLGFPKKSTEFFDKIWKEGYFDPIWQQAENTKTDLLKNRTTIKTGEFPEELIRFKPSEESWKILSVFRYIGIRILSHFPESFDDKESIKIANEWLELGKKLNVLGLDETLEIMQLPFEWSCFKGFAVINTPVFKIVTDSMPCFPKYTIQQESNYYPEEAPKGVKFPWKLGPGCI